MLGNSIFLFFERKKMFLRVSCLIILKKIANGFIYRVKIPDLTTPEIYFSYCPIIQTVFHTALCIPMSLHLIYTCSYYFDKYNPTPYVFPNTKSLINTHNTSNKYMK